MRVKEIMLSPVVTVSQEATLREAVALLSSCRLGGLPVVNAQGDLVGIVTEHDIIKAMLPSYEDILATDAATLSAGLLETRVYAVRDNPVSLVMTGSVITLSEEDTVLKAASTVILKKLKLIPVISGLKPVGIVTRMGIVEAVTKGSL